MSIPFEVLAPGALYWPAAETLVMALSGGAFSQGSLFGEAPFRDALAEYSSRWAPKTVIFLIWGMELPEPEEFDFESKFVGRFSMLEWEGWTFAPDPSDAPPEHSVSIGGRAAEGACWQQGTEVRIPCFDVAPEDVPAIPEAFSAILATGM